MGWLDYDVALWTTLRDEARRGVLKKLPAPIHGFDVRKDAIEFSKGNARAAGIGHLLHFERQDLRDLRPAEGQPGTILCNPPYGERIGEEKELRPLYQRMGEVFGDRCRSWNVGVFTGNDRLARQIRLPVLESVPFWNGKIACRLIRFDLS
jgi:putative N6-adenine-specific DNA methylase